MEMKKANRNGNKIMSFDIFFVEGYLILPLCVCVDWLDLHAVQGLYSNTKLLLVAQSCPALGDPMDCSMSGFPVFHHLPELAQTHVH